MFHSRITRDLKNTIRLLGFIALDIDLSIPENQLFGDYSTNIALQLAKQDTEKRYHSSLEIANEILDKLGHPDYIERIEVAGPGFINFFIKDEFLTQILESEIEKKPENKRVIVEYTDPNTHKDFHIGHVRPLVYGEAVARLFEYRGWEVFRANYGSDIGPTVAKTLWGIGEMADEFKKIREKGSLREKAAFLGKAYALGHKEYESKKDAKEGIDSITEKLYKRDPDLLPVWDETKNWSLAYFDTIYSRFNVEFDCRINESEVEGEGKKIVEENIDRIFVRDQGAVIFPGEKYGLHNRVFITGKGNPTYEAKEIGLTRRYEEIFPFDELVILSHNEQIGFFKVTIKAIEMLDARLTGRKKHLSFGTVSLTTGKLSSRAGGILSAEEVIERVTDEVKSVHGKADPAVVIGAIKFAILKFSPGSDIVFDIKQSVSLQGDSGPYLQYTYARSRSVMEHAGNFKVNKKETAVNLTQEEREVLKQIEYFELTLERASKNLEPSQICYYLLNLARAFNLFYQNCPIIKSERENLRLAVTEKTGEILKKGLNLLNIDAPEKM